MANPGQAPGADAEEPIESRRATLKHADPSEPVMPDGEEMPSPGLSNFGELAPEAARASPLDDIAEAEREQAPRD
ncbi:hypothetical protein [Lichenifustis flavocetrariae]|uniref:Uncharacterized protein n=1 Tax=Lichenifustis flavocetrariae TaxID=2949735 RepID=A0AA41YQ69_9HYPH|nr:hypothetical protein [Lichenifustis flavocetrariae]MCW6506539.1 hypothetical protein [Lichenifustis flavocetrariae]